MRRQLDNSIAGIIIKSASSAAFGSGTNYYCIPANNNVNENSYGWDLFFGDINTMTNGVKTYILQWMSYRLMYELNMKKNINKNKYPIDSVTKKY